jgi:glucose-6-phosphate dehydrogenase assembly protein OpcA
VAADDAHDAETIGETVGELMHEHPSRAIVLKPAAAGEPPSSRVYAQCWMPFGGRQQICCEQIEISTPEGRLEEVARVILGLLAPDLPAVLWARGQRWFERAGFEQIYPLIDKIVVDSCEFDDTATELATMREIRNRRRPRVADLAWARLTMWREMIAHTLEIAAPAAIRASMREIAVEHFGEAPSTACYYMAAWLARALPKAKVSFARAPGEEGRVAGVVLRDGDFELAFRRVEGDTVRISGARESLVVLPHASDFRAMREELTISGADPVFDDVWTEAERLRWNPGG